MSLAEVTESRRDMVLSLGGLMADQSDVFSDADHWTDYFEREALSETGRTVAIVTASVLDTGLSALLKTALLPCPTANDPMFDGAYAPLGSFSAKIDFSARLGLISSGVSQSLHTIRKLRNDFAHGTGSSLFEANHIRQRVRDLARLNDVAKPERRAHFPTGTHGDFLCAASWLVFWVWTIVQRLPARCPECGMRHPPAKHATQPPAT